VIDVRSEGRYYLLCLVALGLVVAAVLGIRNSRTRPRTGRDRENARAASSFGVNPKATTLEAFAVSGFIAAFAGALFVHQQNGLQLDSYSAGESLVVFTMVVIGGLGSCRAHSRRALRARRDVVVCRSSGRSSPPARGCSSCCSCSAAAWCSLRRPARRDAASGGDPSRDRRPRAHGNRDAGATTPTPTPVLERAPFRRVPGVRGLAADFDGVPVLAGGTSTRAPARSSPARHQRIRQVRRLLDGSPVCTARAVDE